MSHLDTAYQLGQQKAVYDFQEKVAGPAGVSASQVAEMQRGLQQILLGNPAGHAALAGGAGALAGAGLTHATDRDMGQGAGRGALGGIAGGLAGSLAGLPLAEHVSNPKLKMLAMLGLPLAGAVGGGMLGAQTTPKQSLLERLGLS